jgi:hypothetical protein
MLPTRGEAVGHWYVFRRVQQLEGLLPPPPLPPPPPPPLPFCAPALRKAKGAGRVSVSAPYGDLSAQSVQAEFVCIVWHHCIFAISETASGLPCP